MSSPGICADCGAQLPAGALGRLCPRCLFEIGLRLEAEEEEARDLPIGLPDTVGPSRRFGDYELLQVIGRGGMGVVYKARQVSLDRTVAVKMMAFDLETNPELVQRFHAEAVSIAQLRHPNIVAIHEVGFREGRHFFVMDYVPGPSLARLAGNQPLAIRRAVDYMKAVAKAVHHAHERGILHRDLKPSNILVDEHDRPLVVDFGLARFLEGNAELTATGQMLGSPHYLSPEQALGHKVKVSRQTDVYALGATLYHLLTGRPPFQAETIAQTLNFVLQNEPERPRLLNPNVPRDLETICLKCLEKESSRRYTTAMDLAEDLERFQAGSPIRARPVSSVGKAWRWCRGKPQIANSIVAFSLVLIVGLITLIWQSKRSPLSHGPEVESEYNHRIATAHQEWLANQVGRTEELLKECPISSRGWEWFFLNRLCHSEVLNLQIRGLGSWAVAYSPDGKYIALSGYRQAKIWNAENGKECATLDIAERGWCTVAFSPDGRHLAGGSHSEIKLYDFRTGKVVKVLGPAHEYLIQCLAYSPDGKRLASTSGNPIKQPGQPEPAGELMAWDLQNGVCQFVIRDEYRINTAAFSPDGKWIASGSGNLAVLAPTEPGRLRIWDSATGKLHLEFKGHTSWITGLAFSPDGQQLASASVDRSIRIWDINSGLELRRLKGHQDWIKETRYSPDGQKLASLGRDRTVRLWDTQTGSESSMIRSSFGELGGIAFHPSGQRLATAEMTELNAATSPEQLTAQVKIWDITREQTHREYRETNCIIATVAFSPNGKWMAYGLNHLLTPGSLPVVVLVDISNGQVLQRIRPDNGYFGSGISRIVFSPDSQTLAALSPPHDVFIWAVPSGQQLLYFMANTESHSALAYSPDGQLLAVGGRSICDRSTGRLKYEIPVNADGTRHYAVAFSADGRYLAKAGSSTWDGRISDGQETTLVKLCEVRSGNELFTVTGGGFCVAYSPDGNQLAAGGDGIIKVFNSHTGALMTTFRGHTGPVNDVVYSHDGRRLVSVGADRNIKIWNLSGGGEILTLRNHTAPVISLAFSPDDRFLASCSEDGTLKLWEAREVDPIVWTTKRKE
jgi:eukaryotic-like serine/threonine-protein kinase